MWVVRPVHVSPPRTQCTTTYCIGTSKERTVDKVYEEMCKGWHAWPAPISEQKFLVTIAISARVTFKLAIHYSQT